MDSIKNIIPSVIGKISAQEGPSPDDIQSLWRKMGGATGSRVMDLKDGVLNVHVDSSMRMVKLNLDKEHFLKQINAVFPSIKRIHFKVAKI